MKNPSNKSQQRTINLLFVVFCCFFLSVFGRFAYIVYVGDIAGVKLKEFSQSRNEKIEKISANRGAILDANKNVIAQNVPSYTVVAILSENQVDSAGKPAYVVDKEKTAEQLAPILKTSKEYVLGQLSKKGVFQVEFGKYGKDLTFEQKAAIESLKIPGLSFVEGIKRYYPNRNFAANVVGFTNYDEELNKTTGKQGLESVYEKELAGSDGQRKYAANAQGMPINPDAVEEITKQDGYTIETTISGDMQRYVEQTLMEVSQTSGAENAFAILVDPQSGKILAIAQTPSFDPNVKENVNSNMFTDRVYEIGSVMKPITVASAIEDKHFDENRHFVSGGYTIDDVTIYDYEKKGWGELEYKDILCHSSNTGISDLLLKQYPSDLFRQKLDTFGFSKPADPAKNIFTNQASTNVKGSVVFKTNIEKVTTGFGQGSTATLMQLLRAYTAIANDGKMVEPHIVNKVTNPNTGEEHYYQPEVSNPINKETARQTRDLMVPVTEKQGCTSSTYKINGIPTAGKSGTSQIIGENGKYLDGQTNTLASFVGMVPAEKPELLLYTGVMKTKRGTPGVFNQQLYTKIMNNAVNYYGITAKGKGKEIAITNEVPNYIGKKVETIQAEISQNNKKIVIIGNGKTVVYQSVKMGDRLDNGVVFLVTDGDDFLMPDISGWSKKDVYTLREYFGLQGDDSGSGFVSGQSIKIGTKIKKEDILNVVYK